MYSIFRNLALILISAKFFALLARKCRAPQVVGEIIAGLVIGPCLLNLVQPSDSIAIFAETGVWQAAPCSTACSTAFRRWAARSFIGRSSSAPS